MKTLVLFGVIAAALAAPIPEASSVLAVHGALPYGVAPAGVHVAAAPLPHAVSYVAPVAHAASYAPAPVPVALPPAQVQVPITRTHVEVPVHQKVHYGTQNYVAGATTTIHKPSLAAPAIAPPTVLLPKVTHNAPEVTIQHQEIPVEKHTPNFVDTPYHAGTIIQYTKPEIKEIKVPTPYAQPVPVPHPVPVAQPVPTPVHSVHQAAHYGAHVAAPVRYGAVFQHGY
ncbi:SH3 domain-containing protein C23A1.17-like [Homarus americanus]|uniref:SH3 domain-containing protein C23A1.17-like n=1 Tax=Homarus americanus TaxID=6706 RepID=UPI001C442719|nr:SH3 domain-containing protein C23A1.17-like [Homarus americanus]